MKKIFLALILTASFNVSAEVTVEQFFGSTQDSQVIYAAGVRDSMETAEAICLPENSTSTQIVAMFKKSINEQPALWNERAGRELVIYLLARFPCKQEQPTTKQESKTDYKF